MELICGTIAISVIFISLFSFLGFAWYCSEKTVRESYKYKKVDPDPDDSKTIWKHSKITTIPKEEDIKEESNPEE